MTCNTSAFLGGEGEVIEELLEDGFQDRDVARMRRRRQHAKQRVGDHIKKAHLALSNQLRSGI